MTLVLLRIGRTLVRLGSRVAVAVIFIGIAAPLIVTIGSSLTSTRYLTFPPSGLSLRWFSAVVQSYDWTLAFIKTGMVTGIAVPISLVLGTLTAYALGRHRFRGSDALTTLFLSPLMCPHTLLGTAVLFFLAGQGLNNTITGLVIVHVLVTLPYVVRLVLVSAEAVDRRIEYAASTLGASPVRRTFTVTVPLMARGIFAAAVFACVESIGEVQLTLFVFGPDTVTAPVQIFNNVQFGFDPTLTAVSAILAVAAFPVLAILDRMVGLEKVL